MILDAQGRWSRGGTKLTATADSLKKAGQDTGEEHAPIIRLEIGTASCSEIGYHSVDALS
mgnify:CR=1 FL=1